MPLIQFECHICGAESDSYRIGVEALKHRDCPPGWVGGTYNTADICPACLARLIPLATAAVAKARDLLGSREGVLPGDVLVRLIRYLASDQPDAARTKTPSKPPRRDPGYRSASRRASVPEPEETMSQETAPEETASVPMTDEAPPEEVPPEEGPEIVAEEPKSD